MTDKTDKGPSLVPSQPPVTSSRSHRALFLLILKPTNCPRTEPAAAMQTLWTFREKAG